jgi:hypothetical protein
MADCHEANFVGFVIDGIDDSEAANAKLAQPVELAQQRLATFRISGNGADRELDGSFQIEKKRLDRVCDVRRDVDAKQRYAGRRFLGRLIGSPKTSSKERPFFPFDRRPGSRPSAA